MFSTHSNKQIPTIFYVLLLALLSSCSDTPMSKLDIRNGVAYKKGTATLFSGDVIAFYPHTAQEKPRVYQTGTYEEGRKRGRWIIYKWNGEREETYYDYGKRHGLRNWYYTHDRIKREQRYANNMMHGEGTYYDEQGTITQQVFYDRNRRISTPHNRLKGIKKISAKPDGRGWMEKLVAAVNDFF